VKSAFFSGNNAHLYGIETKKAKKKPSGRSVRGIEG